MIYLADDATERSRSGERQAWLEQVADWWPSQLEPIDQSASSPAEDCTVILSEALAAFLTVASIHLHRPIRLLNAADNRAANYPLRCCLRRRKKEEVLGRTSFFLVQA